MSEPYERTVVINIPTTVTVMCEAEHDGTGRVVSVSRVTAGDVGPREVEECLDGMDELHLLDPKEEKES